MAARTGRLLLTRLLFSLALVCSVLGKKRRGGGMPDPGCAYKCANGAVPEVDPKHKPTFNGCGVPGFMIDSKWLTPCCNEHDICYHTCQTGKNRTKGQEICDDLFIKCMKRICASNKGAEKTECSGEADMMGMGVQMLGCQAYLDSQAEACACPEVSPEDAALSKLSANDRERLVMAFYKKHDDTKGGEHVKKVLAKVKSGRQFVAICARLFEKYKEHPRDFISRLESSSEL